jgi:iron(III) transport system substrate-binding protein
VPTAAVPATSEWDAIVAAARQEGALVLSTEPGTGYQKFVERIQQQFPWMRVEHIGLRPSDFAPRVLTEQRNGQYLWDFFVGPSSNMLRVMGPAGGLEPIKPFLQGLSPEATDHSKWYGGFEIFSDPDKPATLLNQFIETGGVYVNRDQVPAAEFKTIDDLLQPKWKGKIIVYNPAQSTGGSQSLSALVASRGEDYLRKLLADQEMVKVETQRQTTEWLTTGRYPIAIGIDRELMRDYQSKGVGRNVERIKDEAVYLHSRGLSVLTRPPHPNATRVFMNWFFSQEGQDAWASTIPDGSSRRVDVKVYHPDTTPDYNHLERYKVRIATVQGEAFLDRVLDIVNER